MSLRIGLAVASAAFCAMTCLAQYKVTNLGSLGASFPNTFANGINNAGQVAGVGEYADFSISNPFRTRPNSPINPATDNLGLLPGVGANSGSATSINNSGQVAGNAFTPSSACTGCFTSLAFRADPGNPTLVNLGTRSIPSFPGVITSTANSINSSGQVTGGATTETAVTPCSATVESQAYRTAADGLVSASAELGTVQVGSCGYSFGYAINSSGQVVGYSNLGGLFGSTTHASLATPGMPMQDLGTLGGTISTAVSINDAGQIVGYSDFNPSMLYHPHAFLTTAAGPMHDLGTLGGTYISATSINNGGQIVGNSTLAGDAVVHAFISQNGTMTDLNTLIPAASNWVLENATGINDAGQIVGNGTLNGVQAAFRLDPPANIGVNNLITELSTVSLGISAGELGVLSATLKAALPEIARINQGAAGPGGQFGVTVATFIATADLTVFVDELQILVRTGMVTAQNAAPLETAATNIIANL